MGVESITASDGEQGLALLKSSLHLDLVISDISTPGLDGIALFKIIQQDGALTDVPWMFMSFSDRKYDALESGCAYFLGKPVTLGDLKWAVATTLDQSMITTM
jgi:CheY-like chemotaxis protein